MKILEKLNNEETTATDKLAEITRLVIDVRTRYGNENIEIQTPKVPTTEGMSAINLLTKEEKVAVATSQIKEVIQMASAVSENTEGTLFDRVFEGFIAVNPILCNLNQESDSEY